MQCQWCGKDIQSSEVIEQECDDGRTYLVCSKDCGQKLCEEVRKEGVRDADDED